jgi:hypothetical protein
MTTAPLPTPTRSSEDKATWPVVVNPLQAGDPRNVIADSCRALSNTRPEFNACLAKAHITRTYTDEEAQAAAGLPTAERQSTATPTAAVLPNSIRLTDREGILLAMQRARSAIGLAKLTLDTSVLTPNLAGHELEVATATVDDLRASGLRHMVQVTDVTVLSAEIRADVDAHIRTRERLELQVFEATSGRPLRHDPPRVVELTYTVEKHDGRWVVTDIANYTDPQTAPSA